jgi:hypothetical protein
LVGVSGILKISKMLTLIVTKSHKAQYLGRGGEKSALQCGYFYLPVGKWLVVIMPHAPYVASPISIILHPHSW